MPPHPDRRHSAPGSTPRGGPGSSSSDGDEAATGTTIRVHPATAPDADTAATLHAAGISEGFLSLLGTGFLSLLYRRIRLHPSSFLLVGEGRNTTVGFIAGSTDVGGLYRSFLRRDGLVAALRALGPLVSGWRRVLETLRHRTPGANGPGQEAELLSVAVDPAWEGRGVARLLVAAFLDEVVARGCRTSHVVVGAANERAIHLYRGAGFVTVMRFELHAGTQSLLMEWTDTGLAHSPGGGRR